MTADLFRGTTCEYLDCARRATVHIVETDQHSRRLDAIACDGHAAALAGEFDRPKTERVE